MWRCRRLGVHGLWISKLRVMWRYAPLSVFYVAAYLSTVALAVVYLRTAAAAVVVVVVVVVCVLLQVYDQYTYATVKGAGHEVPMFQPNAAYNMITRFISGNAL